MGKIPKKLRTRYNSNATIRSVDVCRRLLKSNGQYSYKGYFENKN